MFKMSVSPQAAPDASTFVEVEFAEGVPTKLTNETDGTVKVRATTRTGGGSASRALAPGRPWDDGVSGRATVVHGG